MLQSFADHGSVEGEAKHVTTRENCLPRMLKGLFLVYFELPILEINRLPIKLSTSTFFATKKMLAR